MLALRTPTARRWSLTASLRSARFLAASLLVASLVSGCEESSQEQASPAASAKSGPDINLVVRTVELKKNMKTRPVEGTGDDESWTAVDGKIYAIVTADLAHNACKAGDKIETSKAALTTPEGEIKPVGGGSTLDKLCVQCQPTEDLDCNNASRLRPYTFLFEVGENSDVKKAKLTYRGQESALSSAKIKDSRGNDEISQKIAQKQAQIDQLKKKLENTSNVANGKVIQSEMAALQKEIDTLEKQKK